MSLKNKGFGSMLDILARCDGISQAELAERARIRRQSAGEALSRLEREGFVRREASESDKRSVLVYITETGRREQKEMKARREQMAERFFGCLDPAEKESLYRILSKLEHREE